MADAADAPTVPDVFVRVAVRIRIRTGGRPLFLDESTCFFLRRDRPDGRVVEVCDPLNLRQPTAIAAAGDSLGIGDDLMVECGGRGVCVLRLRARLQRCVETLDSRENFDVVGQWIADLVLRRHAAPRLAITASINSAIFS